MKITKALKHVLEPLAATILISYHNQDFDPGTEPPEVEVTARVLELPSHVAFLSFRDIVIPFEEEVLSATSMHTTMTTGFQFPPPPNANRAPFWTNIVFGCVRMGMEASATSIAYNVRHEEHKAIYKYPISQTTMGPRVYAPGMESWESPPIEMRAVRFQDVVGMHFYLHWSPWRNNGSPEHSSLQDAVRGLRTQGWRLDQGQKELFNIDT